jgi:hypothetical protein
MAQMQAPLSLNALMPTNLMMPRSGDAPLSGDVTQSILPWHWMSNWIGNKFSLFSVNLGRSAAPEVESEILDEVGSYGRQLGRISDVLEVLVARLPRESLSPQEVEAIEDFSVQMREIRRIKQARMGSRAR